MAALRYILLAAAITLTLALLAHLVLPARGPIPRRTGRRGQCAPPMADPLQRRRDRPRAGPGRRAHRVPRRRGRV